MAQGNTMLLLEEPISLTESLEPGGVEFEPNETGSNWFHEAVHTAMSAISDDQPFADDAINGPEAEKWKAAMEEELTQINHWKRC